MRVFERHLKPSFVGNYSYQKLPYDTTGVTTIPYDINGNYTLPTGYKVSIGMKVLPSQHNPPLEDIKAALSSVLVIDGRKPMAGDLKMGGNRVTGLSDGVDPDDAATVGQAAFSIGDGKYSLRDLGEKWLRRNGALYDKDDYPDLADLLPPLPDGIILNSATSGTTLQILDMAYGNGKYVAVGSGGLILVSTDRLNWSIKDSGTTQVINGITYAAGIWVGTVANGSVIKSPDTEAWSIQGVTGLTAAQGIVHDGTNFIVSGANSTAPRASYSADGNSWTTVTPPGANSGASIATNGSRAVIVGVTGLVNTSDDHGATWTARTSGTTNNFIGVDWDATTGLFIAVGAGGTIRTSPDGAGWTGRTSGVSSTLRSVDGSAQGIVVVGDSGVVLLSANGTSYTSAVTGISQQLNNVLADQNVAYHYVIGGVGGYIADGVRTMPTQFRVPNDGANEWIRALA